MSTLQSIGGYLPPWGTAGKRTCGLDEDAVTLAVAAGRQALAGGGERVTRVVMVTRRPPLLEGDNGAALLAGLGLPATTEVVEQLGGGPATIEALASAAPGTLVIGVDTDDRAGAAAALNGTGGIELTSGRSINRSLPVRTRDLEGVLHEYDDPRLLRERGAMTSLGFLGLDEKAAAVVGLSAREAAAFAATVHPPHRRRARAHPSSRSVRSSRVGATALSSPSSRHTRHMRCSRRG